MHVWDWTTSSVLVHVNPFGVAYIEDITWPGGDTNFIASLTRGRYFQHSKIKFVAPSGHIMFCLFYRYWWNSYIKDNPFFYSFSKQQNSAIKVVTYRKMPVTKMLWSSMWKFGRSSRKSPVNVPSSHLEAILWMKFQRNRPRAWAWAGSSLVIALSCCNHGDTNILTRERKK